MSTKLECTFVANDESGRPVVWVTDKETLELMRDYNEKGDVKAVSLVFHVGRHYGRVHPAQTYNA